MQINDLREQVNKRYEALGILIKNLEKVLASKPDARFRVSHAHGNTYYYLVKDSERNGHIIAEADLPLIRQLAQYNYYEKVLKSACREQSILTSLKNHYDNNLLEDIYSNLNPERQAMVNPLHATDEKFKNEWLAKPYKRKVLTSETPSFKTAKGDMVRSKSEMIIANALYAKDIPYKYECPLYLKNSNMTIHPDFTILRMSDRREIYLEHYGMLDDPSYAQRAVQRNNAYAHDGIILGERLYVTMESGRIPLDTESLNTLIEKVFR